MRSPTEVLSRLQEKAKDKTYRFERLYRNLYNSEFYMLAYQKVYANKGSMTPGVDGSTMDGMSPKRIEQVIASLRDESYHPAPARRTYIAKRSNPAKKRPLGIPSGNDKLVQGIVRMILEAIYEPVFSMHSHGFRPNKSCHSALLDIQRSGRGCTWFIEGDITACFDSFDRPRIQTLIGVGVDIDGATIDGGRTRLLAATTPCRTNPFGLRTDELEPMGAVFTAANTMELHRRPVLRTQGDTGFIELSIRSAC